MKNGLYYPKKDKKNKKKNKRWTSPCFHPSTKHTSKNYSKMKSNYYNFVTQKSQFEQEKINSEMVFQNNNNNEEEDQDQDENYMYTPVGISKISRRDRSGLNFDEEVDMIDHHDHRNSSRNQNKSQDEKQQEWLDEFLHGRGFDVEELKDSQIKVFVKIFPFDLIFMFYFSVFFL